MSIKYRPSYESVIDSMSPGDTVRINHKDCPAGVDTRKRLYLTKPVTGGGNVLAFCHNCQEGGRWKSTPFRTEIGSEYGAMTDDLDSGEFVMPELEGDENLWPALMNQYLWQYGLDFDLLSQYGVAYVADTHSIYLPILDKCTWYADSGRVSHFLHKGYQLRRLVKHSGSKYVTHMADDTYDMQTILTLTKEHEKPRQAVIVEDVLSGLRIIQAAQCYKQSIEVLVNRGIKINVEAISNLEATDRINVWLDNDSLYVDEMANKMCRTAGLIKAHHHCFVVDELRDPKHCSYQDIKEALGWTA